MSDDLQQVDDIYVLPTVDERPEADVVIFDSHCAFCTAQVRRLNAWDRGRRRSALADSLCSEALSHAFTAAGDARVGVGGRRRWRNRVVGQGSGKVICGEAQRLARRASFQS